MRTRRRSRNEVAVLLLIKASFFDLKSASWQIEETVDFPDQRLTAQISSSLLLRRVALLLSVCDVLAECLRKNTLPLREKCAKFFFGLSNTFLNS